jgi:hypothetical protein
MDDSVRSRSIVVAVVFVDSGRAVVSAIDVLTDRDRFESRCSVA